MLLQVSSAVPSSPIDLVLAATTVTQAVLVLLACLSLLSWSIMFGVWRSLASASNHATKFARDFERAERLDEASALTKVASPGALPRLFMRAMSFVSDARVANQQVRERATPTAGSAP